MRPGALLRDVAASGGRQGRLHGLRGRRLKASDLAATVSAPTASAKTHGRGALATLAAIGALYFALGVGADMLFALLPAIGDRFGVGAVTVTWLVTARSGSK